MCDGNDLEVTHQVEIIHMLSEKERQDNDKTTTHTSQTTHANNEQDTQTRTTHTKQQLAHRTYNLPPSLLDTHSTRCLGNVEIMHPAPQ